METSNEKDLFWQERAENAPHAFRCLSLLAGVSMLIAVAADHNLIAPQYHLRSDLIRIANVMCFTLVGILALQGKTFIQKYWQISDRGTVCSCGSVGRTMIPSVRQLRIHVFNGLAGS